MSSIVVAGDTSGSVTLSAPPVAGTPVLTLPTTSGIVLAPSGGILPVSQGGTGQGGFANNGGVVYSTLSGTLAATASPGTSGQVLTSTGAAGVPQWTTIAAGGITLSTAQTSPFTPTTQANFITIPAGVKRITVMFAGVSKSGTSPILIQIGSSSVIQITGYSSSASRLNGIAASSHTNSSAGFVLEAGPAAADLAHGICTITNITGNVWTGSSVLGYTASSGQCMWGGGSVTLTGVLNTLRVTTVNGTDTLDAGTINIMYE